MLVSTARIDVKHIKIYLVGIARKEYGAVAHTQSTFLLLTLLIDFGHRPGLDVICCCFGGSDSVSGVYIRAGRSRRLRKSEYPDTIEYSVAYRWRNYYTACRSRLCLSIVSSSLRNASLVLRLAKSPAA